MSCGGAPPSGHNFTMAKSLSKSLLRTISPVANIWFPSDDSDAIILMLIPGWGLWNGMIMGLLQAYSLYVCVCVAEVSGTITEMTELARKNTDLKEGDRVMALVGGGGYAGMVYTYMLGCHQA